LLSAVTEFLEKPQPPTEVVFLFERVFSVRACYSTPVTGKNDELRNNRKQEEEQEIPKQPFWIVSFCLSIFAKQPSSGTSRMAVFLSTLSVSRFNNLNTNSQNLRRLLS
jgi:hypothetical protein